jgi:ssDNA-binding Zn-finger/Zn-ribbon topoisomerase 1
MNFKPKVIEQSQTNVWQLLPFENIVASDIAIARLYWEFVLTDDVATFTYSNIVLAKQFDITQHKLRKIQLSVGVLQPPVGTICTNCGATLHWIGFKNRSEFQEHLRRQFVCNACIIKRNEKYKVEQARHIAAQKAERENELQRKYGDRIIGDCPLCDGVRILRKARNGGVFIGCSNFPDCEYTSPVPKPEPITPKDLQEFAEARRLLALAPKCPQCGLPMLQRNGKYGAFLGCTGYPKCPCIVPLPTEPVIPKPVVPAIIDTAFEEHEISEREKMNKVIPTEEKES